MKMRYITVCLICVFLCSTFCVGAQEQFQNMLIDYNRASGTVSISGEATFVTDAAEMVRMMVVRPNTDIEKLASGELSFAQSGIHADETTLSVKNFTFPTFTMGTGLTAGDYIVRIAVDGKVYTDEIYFATVAQTIALFNQAADESDIGDCLKKYNDVYQLELGEGSAYASLSGEGQKYVRKRLSGGGFADVEAIQASFQIHTLLYKIYTGPWGAVESVILDNSQLLTLNMNRFNALTGGQQDTVYKTLTGNLYKSAGALSSAFDEAVAAAEKEPEKEMNQRSSGGNPIMKSKPLPDMVPGNEEENNGGEPLPFHDLGQYDWAKDSILLLYQKGIVSGKAAGVFAPGAQVTRAEAVKMIILALGELDSSAVCSFSDVSADAWSYPYLATAVQNGIITGYEDGKAGAADYITREELATMILRAELWRGQDYGSVNSGILFDDADEISPYAQEAVAKLYAAGVISGAEHNLFLPKDYATRAQTAKILAALID